jgi:hypothetical protein
MNTLFLVLKKSDNKDTGKKETHIVFSSDTYEECFNVLCEMEKDQKEGDELHITDIVYNISSETTVEPRK